jgi:hypothetical protein
MDRTCLEHSLSAAERAAFDRDGFFVLDRVLPDAQIGAIEAACDRIDAEERRRLGADAHERVVIRDILWRDPTLLELIDLPTTLPKVWGILGWNIQIYHSVLAYSPPEPPERRKVRHLGWHQDSGRLNQEMESSPRPRISLKVAYALSDISVEGRANFWMVPGSHLMDRYEVPVDGSMPAGAVPLMVLKGGAFIFDRRIWHAATSNASDVTRKVLFYGYSYRWIRPRDDQSVAHLIPDVGPIRQQLLGHCFSDGYGYSSPSAVDVPLRGWLEQNEAQAA